MNWVRMATFQFRLGGQKSIGEVAEELTFGIWRSLNWRPGFRDLDRVQFAELRSAIRRIFELFVHAYDICGSHSICDQTLEPCSWTPSGMRLIMSSGWYLKKAERRFVVELPNGLEDLVIAIEQATLHLRPLSPAIKEEMASLVRPIIVTAVKRSLGPHLFRNPVCNEHPYCQRRQPVDLWTGDSPSVPFNRMF
ncbi:MAG TPA: hypothetical protein VMU17_00755 [Elusimicrobiota bacterium]|nr:hypothetical protein [Elusimicrobiota bacterium]